MPKQPTGKHGLSRYNKRGCRCDICMAAMRNYTRNTICADCGNPCQRSKPQRGWTPSATARCIDCYRGRRPKPICVCGNTMSREARTCFKCRWPNRSGRRKRRPSQLGHRAWRRLRDQVIEEEPTCRLQLPGCIGTSETGDHIIPVSRRPDLKFVRNNVRGSCHHCNLARGTMPLDQAKHVLGTADTPEMSGFSPIWADEQEESKENARYTE